MRALNPRAGRILALILVAAAAVTALIVGVSRSSSSPALEATSDDKPVSRSEAAPAERVFISGSMVNLREAASAAATVVKQLPIGTECVVEEKAPSGWWRIGCGDSKGWAKAELLSAERPALEPLLALAQDSNQPLQARFDAALRATALEPAHAAARELLWSLFAEQEWAQFENLLTEEPSRLPLVHAAVACNDWDTTTACLKDAVAPGALASWYHLKSRTSERLGGSVFVGAALMKLYDKTKPPELLVRVGTFKGDSKALDIQVFTQSRYVPSDTLKSALEKLPKTHENPRILKRDAILTSEQRETIRQLEGNWTQLARGAQGLVIRYYCDGSPPAVHLEMLEDHVKVDLEFGQDSGPFNVGGVQLAKDGSITLMELNGETLKHARAREDTRVSRWTYSGYDVINGLFVRSDQEDAFPTEKPDCDDFY